MSLTDHQRYNVKKWIEQLFKGEYKQGQSFLAKKVDDDDTTILFCCLGVACELKGVRRVLREYDEKTFDYVFLDGEHVVIRGDMPYYKFMLFNYGMNKDDMEMLAKLNDEGASFEQIAMWIKAWLYMHEKYDVVARTN